MGFFSNLKNAVTGGAAAVEVRLPTAAQRGHSVPVTIQATARSSGKVGAVYVLIRAAESAQIKDTDYANGTSRSEVVHGFKVTYEARVPIAGGLELEAGKAYTWEGEVALPAHVNPTFAGQMIGHRWELQAALEMTGNDPDSGWQPLHVS